MKFFYQLIGVLLCFLGYNVFAENYVLSSDITYFKPTLVTLGSLNEISVNEKVPNNVYIFFDGTQEEYDECSLILEEKSVLFNKLSLKLIKLTEENIAFCKNIKTLFDPIKEYHHLIYFKLLLLKIFNEDSRLKSVKEILYLDSDLLIEKPLDELFTLGRSSQQAIWACNLSALSKNSFLKVTSTADYGHSFFSSGVIFMNFEKIDYSFFKDKFENLQKLIIDYRSKCDYYLNVGLEEYLFLEYVNEKYKNEFGFLPLKFNFVANLLQGCENFSDPQGIQFLSSLLGKFLETKKEQLASEENREFIKSPFAYTIRGKYAEDFLNYCSKDTIVFSWLNDTLSITNLCWYFPMLKKDICIFHWDNTPKPWTENSYNDLPFIQPFFLKWWRIYKKYVSD